MKPVFLSLLLLVCSTQNTFHKFSDPSPPSHPSTDPSTYANVDYIVTTHFALDIYVDFTKEVLTGTNTVSLLAKQTVSQVVFDYQGITIYNVTDSKGNLLTIYEQTPDPDLGSALIVMLPSTMNKGDTVDLVIAYQTTTEAQAFSWMNPSQTSSKTLNYMFTQCEPIHCRSVAPLQDTPSIKSTYTAKVTVDAPYVVYMSANITSKDTSGADTWVYQFDNSIPIPSYLLAIAVGNLTYQKLGSRTGVITEPSFLANCVSELSDLELYLDTTEKYLTPYIWGTYTILVLPPSFPYGGMENPLLTFASPTIIVGDKSQVYVATHEICHSWTGNDLTCENWSNMWLNEGFTVYEERNVSSQIYSYNFAMCEAILGNQSLYDDINNYGVTNSYSSLYPVLDGHSPDDSFSEVPYEKGYQFLYYMQTFIGPDMMQQFLRYYINKYPKSSVNVTQLNQTWVTFIEDNISDQTKRDNILQSIDWNLWVYTPGYPPVHFNFTNPDSLAATNLADAYVEMGGNGSPSNYLDYHSFYSNQKVIFILQLIQRQSEFGVLLLQRLDIDLSITTDINPEVKQRWYPLGIAFKYDYVIEPAHQFVSSQGRMKYLNPIYQALCEYGYRDLAYQWYEENLDFYHPIAIATLQKILLQYVPTPQSERLFLKHALFLKHGGMQ